MLDPSGLPRGILCDLHVHIGRSQGRPVKITAGPGLTVRSAMAEAALRKGIGVLGIADAAAAPVLNELTGMELAGELVRTPGGGYAAAIGGVRPPLLLVPGAEMELLVCGRPVHVLALMPDLAAVRQLVAVLDGHVRNPSLGCQRVHDLDIRQLSAAVRGTGGMLGLAHAFTPHKGFYGSVGMTLRELGLADPADLLDFVEMGLSADTAMASLLRELDDVALLAASDAHSTGAIGREMTELRQHAGGESSPDFAMLAAALTDDAGRGIAQYFGLDPRLGKYHRDACRACGWNAGGVAAAAAREGRTGDDHPDDAGDAFCAATGGICPACGSVSGFVPGVYECIERLAAAGQDSERHRAGQRPPYRHVVPLRMLPGIGRAAAARLVAHSGSELAAALTCPEAELAQVAGPDAAAMIMAARQSRLQVVPGGGGLYGHIRGS